MLLLVSADRFLHDLDLLVGQSIQLIDDLVDQVVGALNLLVEFFRPLDGLPIPSEMVGQTAVLEPYRL